MKGPRNAIARILYTETVDSNCQDHVVQCWVGEQLAKAGLHWIGEQVQREAVYLLVIAMSHLNAEDLHDFHHHQRLETFQTVHHIELLYQEIIYQRSAKNLQWGQQFLKESQFY